MKKSLAIIFSCIFLISIISAQTIRSPEETFGKYIESVERLKSQSPDDYANNIQNRFQGEPLFLFFGMIFGVINGIFNFISPLFLILFRETYSISIRFFFILIMWCTIFYQTSKLLKDSFIEGNKAYIAGFLIAWIVG